MTWVKFKIDWQDGLYIYNPGKIVDLPSDLARRYVESEKAAFCNPPKWSSPEVAGKKKKKIPSARSHIKRMSAKTPTQSLQDLASQMIDEEV